MLLFLSNFLCFNSRPHEEVDNCLITARLSMYRFNSRPHEEVDEKLLLKLHDHEASTHDLTKRSTVSAQPQPMPLIASTHDLTKRSTVFLPDQRLRLVASTHDLTKRSTGSLRASPERSRCFNSRPHEEVDILARLWL